MGISRTFGHECELHGKKVLTAKETAMMKELDLPSLFSFYALFILSGTSFCAGYAEDEEQACCWDHHKKEKE